MGHHFPKPVPGDDEIVMYIVVRKDIGMSPGKVAAQAGHAVQMVLLQFVGDEGPPTSDKVLLEKSMAWFGKWLEGSYTKIVLGASEQEMNAVCDLLALRPDVLWSSVEDEGRTEVPPGTITALGFQPMPKSTAKVILGKLRLL